MPLGTPCEIAFWLGTRRHTPTVDEIVERWRVARPTAYRWRAFALQGGISQSARRERSAGAAYDHYTRIEQ